MSCRVVCYVVPSIARAEVPNRDRAINEPICTANVESTFVPVVVLIVVVVGSEIAIKCFRKMRLGGSIYLITMSAFCLSK